MVEMIRKKIEFYYPRHVSNRSVILEELKKNQDGLTARQIVKIVKKRYEVEDTTLKVILSQMVKIGLIGRTKKLSCECCGSNYTTYVSIN